MEEKKNAAQNLWGKSPAGSSLAPDKKPGTKEYFELVRNIRNREELHRVLEQIPFKTFSHKKVLELGCGQGFDAYEFSMNQSHYTGIDLAPENIERTRLHLSHYGLTPHLQQADAENLPFEDESYDLVYANGVLHHTPNIEKSFREAHRVLAKDGTFLVVLYHKHSIVFWLQYFLYEYILRRQFLKCSLKTHLSKIEFSHDSQDSNVLVQLFSKKRVRKLLKQNGFKISKLSVRKLNHEDFPSGSIIKYLWLLFPRSLLDIMGEKWGWYIIAAAQKT
ncbi:MAG: putative methyltransferase YcgJ [Chlamydiae bacterium]|nr:putative methyltransferase YcgJ [Chlamydiota bacterium]